MILHRGRCLFKGGEDDEDITSNSTTSPIEDAAEIRLGPMTRSRSKLIEQQVNSLLCDYDNFIDENFILPKSMHLCMIRFIDNTRVDGGEHHDREENIMEHEGGATQEEMRPPRTSPRLSHAIDRN